MIALNRSGRKILKKIFICFAHLSSTFYTAFYKNCGLIFLVKRGETIAMKTVKQLLQEKEHDFRSIGSEKSFI